MIGELADAFGWLARHPVLLPLWVLGTALSITLLPNLALIPLFAKNVLAVGPEGLGMLVSAVGVGQLLGALVAIGVGALGASGRLQLAGYVAQGVILSAFALSSSFILSVAALATFGVLHGLLSSHVHAIVQRLTPAAAASRMQGLFMFVFGLVPIGQLLVGAIADRIGLQVAVAALALSFTICALLITLVAAQVRAFRFTTVDPSVDIG